MNCQAAVVLLILFAPLQPSQAAEYRYPGVYLQEGPGPKRIDGVRYNELRPGTGGACMRSKMRPGSATAVPYADIGQGSSLADVTQNEARHVSA